MPASADFRAALPPRAAIFGALRREVAHTLAPELSSDRARATASLIDEALRFLLLQEQAGQTDLLQTAASEQAACRAQLAFDGSVEHMLFADERLHITPERLAAYLAGCWPERDGLRVTSLERILGGFSKDTYLFDVSWNGGADGFALQRDNPWGTVDSHASDVYACLAEMHRLGIPVPEPVLLETGNEPFGHAFIVTRKASGRALSNIVGLDMGDAQTATALALADVLGRLHAITPDQLDPALFPNRFNRADTEFATLVDRLEADWQRFRVTPSSTVSAAIGWLRANIPESSGPLRIVHGDAGMHNLLIDGGQPSAMLDWEFFHLGDPMEDLEYARGWVEAVMPWDDFVARYRQAGGPPVAEGRSDFYTAFYAVRHIMTTDKGLSGFGRSPQPELNSLCASTRYGRHFTLVLGDLLHRHGWI